jgi:hypothetical protein
MTDSSFDSKLYSGRLEQLSSVFGEMFAHLEIEPVMMFYVTTFNTQDFSFVVKAVNPV